MNALQGSFN